MTLSVGDVIRIERTIGAANPEMAHRYRVVALGLVNDPTPSYSPGGRMVAMLETIE